MAPSRTRLFIHAADGCAAVLYHRDDGHYGLITPAG
nr:sigma 54 modulation/S30EA ribosomal C-terminal domain-containing protein [Mycobacterium paraseoulense]